MSAAVVFAGPSLAGLRGPAPAGVELRGPAEAGDVYRAARDGARVIGLVDGVFEDRPTVWHKEILWALDHGARVLGGASLGALRAAECAAFGMEGVGQIVDQLRVGGIRDDSDLAVVYAPEALGWQPLTEARVNVRATLDAAREAGVLDAEAAGWLAERAESLPFRVLTWPALLADAPEEVRDRLTGWLPVGRVDLKRADALALLEAVGAATPAPRRDAPPMPETRYWRAAVEWFDASAPAPGGEAVLDELRLDPARFERALVRAYARRAAGAEPAAAADDAPDPRALLDEFRADLGLDGAAGFRDWLAASGADAAAVARALAAEERLDRALDRATRGLLPAILDALRIDGRHETLARRAADKRARLAGRRPPAFDEVALGALIDGLRAGRRAAIDSDDPEVLAGALGLGGREALFRLLADERDYVEALAGGIGG